MADCVQIVQPPSSPQKRLYSEISDDFHLPLPSIEARSQQIVNPTPPRCKNSPNHIGGPLLPDGASRQPSPALSSISTLTSIEATPPPFGLDETSQSGLGIPPAKRRKLTFAEREVRKAEKAEKERVKVEQKTKKEEEKQAKDEEQKLKNEAKEEKRRQRELEKQQKEQEKEDEKRRKEEEKVKKEKAQPRIMSFFAKPQQPFPSATISQAPIFVNGTPPPILRRSSIPATSYYDRTFLPFSLPSNAVCAPVHRFSWDDEARNHLENTFDNLSRTSTPDVHPAPRLKDSLAPSPWDTAPRGMKHFVKQIMSDLAHNELNQGNSNDSRSTSEHVRALLRSIPTKFIFFHEDVRPPYIGTYTKGITIESGLRIARNPFKKLRSDTDYDYDSEAEWEEPEEGEDLESEGESDAESVDTAEDFDGFLDDAEAADGQAKRKMLPGDMDPVCSGLIWENEAGRIVNYSPFKLELLKLEVIECAHKLPIDPYSTSYWADAQSVTPQTAVVDDAAGSGRPPLFTRPNGIFGGVSGLPIADTISKSGSGKPSKPPPRVLTGEDLEEFKKAIEGSPHNKQGLLAILKKERFPKISAAVLKDTLGVVGARVGRTEAEKKWIIINST